MGALVVTPIRSGVVGNLKYAIVDVTGSTSYATGGETLPVANLNGFEKAIQFVDINSSDATVADNRFFQPVPQADGSFKLVMLTAVNTEVANATNVTTISCRLMCFGF